MRIEASDLAIELVIKSASGSELGAIAVPASELISHFIKSDSEAKAAADQKREPPYNRVAAFKQWIAEKGEQLNNPCDFNGIHDELFGALFVKTYNAIDTIQKKMLETESGKPS